MIRILLVDDQQSIRDYLQSQLDIDLDIEVIGTADNGKLAIQQVARLKPDVVLMDMEMPDMDGVSTTKIIHQRFPNTKILVLSGYDKNQYIHASLDAGAMGYLLKNASAEELKESIRFVNKGYTQLAPGLLGKIVPQAPVSHLVETSSLPLKRNYRQTHPWLLPLLLGTGVGVAIFFRGISEFTQRPTTQNQAIANKSAQPLAPAMTVTVAEAETTSIANTLIVKGSVAAHELIPVLPQTNGLMIENIPPNIKEGAFVKQGQLLAVLDDSLLQTQISQANADIESQKADVASKQAQLASRQAAVAANEAVVDQRRADLAQAQAKLEEAQKNFQRYEKLAVNGAISQQELDTRQTNVKTAREAVRLAQANISGAQANVRSAQADIATAQANLNRVQASVRSSAARVQQLKTQLGKTLVRAPVSGIIAEQLARVGDITGIPPQTQLGSVIGGSQKLFSIIRDGKLELWAQVPSIQLPQVKIGSPAVITSDVDNSVRLQGKVREIKPVVNQSSREAIVKIDLPNTKLLKPGVFARAAITTNTAMGIAVPQKAVLPQPDGSAIVFTLAGGDTVRAQKVETGEIINGARVEIKSGLPAGAQVVVNGAGYLKDGDKVKVVKNNS
ncbi:MAG: efflux RND transporter periplasmic adaptor subunit [Nostocaceae cyanobacterium]|nr:efflux RND transporter periplasmic adaptor subunit [Nostocaceae cyanobacterium]